MTWTQRRDRSLRIDGPADADGNLIRLEISYLLGGSNYFTGRQEPRGFSLSIRPVQVSEGTERWLMTADPEKSGMRVFLMGAARFSEKTLVALGATWEPLAQEILETAKREGIRVAAAFVRDEQLKVRTA